MDGDISSLISNSLQILISEDFNKWRKLRPTLITNMQARQLKYNFELHKRGLAPREFEASLTKKVDGLLESTGVNRLEPFIKEAIRKVKTEVYGTRRKTDGLWSVHSFEEHDFNDMSSFGAPSYRQQGQRRRRGQSRKEMYHNKQNELFAGALQPKFQLFRDRGIPLKHDQDGYLFRGEKMLTAPEFCNVVDQFSADFLKDLSRLGGDSQWRPTVDFREISKLCKQILISRLNAAHWSVGNDLMAEGNYHKWRAHVMVIISFAALMVVAEITLKELEKLGRHGEEKRIFLFLVFAAISLFFHFLTDLLPGRPRK